MVSPLIAEPAQWTPEQLAAELDDGVFVWCTPSVREAAAALLSHPVSLEPPQDAKGFHTLVAIGGGTLLDQAKVLRRTAFPSLRLITVPSIWGSGAEVSSIAVLNVEGRKDIQIDAALTPNIYVHMEALTATIPEARAVWACGDVLAHALEGAFSPLASGEVRAELAHVLQQVSQLPLGKDARWFAVSAAACRGQAKSGVGLVHGFAHSLEGPLQTLWPDGDIGHARLCATFLWPVMAFNRSRANKWDLLMEEYGLDGADLFARLQGLYEDAIYEAARPLIVEGWRRILRDPCTRTNSVLVRPEHLTFFQERQFR